MRRVGKGFSGVDTPLFEGMLVEQQVANDIANIAVNEVVDDVAEDVAEPTQPSPILTTTPSPPQELPSTSQVAPTPTPSPIAQPSLPPLQQQPSQPTKFSMDLLQSLLETCIALTKRVENLEQDKIAQALEIIKLKQRVKKLEKKKKLRVSGLKRLRKARTAQRIESSTDTVIDYLEVTTATTTITVVASITAATITATSTAARRRKGVVIRDPEETAAPSTIIHTEPKSKDKGKGIMVQEPKRTELKKHLQIVPNDDDDVYTKVTPLALKVPVVDYAIYTENNKPYYKIIRADESHQLFLSFLSLLRNFDREDLEMLWQLVQERFASSKPKNFSDDFLLTILTYMFEKLDVEAQVWKNQRSVLGLAKFKS
nr:hypothetical protein [Tanacetum cinerariifolium]